MSRILYNPYPHQQAIHDSLVKRKYIMQPIRSGKDICLVNDNTKFVIETMPIWSARPDTMSPKLNIWFVAETYELLSQLWRDVLAYTPRELLAGEPKFGNLEIPIINGGRYKFRSAKNESYLVAEGLDRLNVTEAGELPQTAWDLLQSRLSSPDRLELASMFADGTPRGQVDPQNPTKDHWFWAEVKAARGGNGQAESWYWFEDRHNYGGLEHPILSLTVEGQVELNRKRNDPNFSERKFREDYLGECLPVVLGDPAIEGFNRVMHVRPVQFSARYRLHRTWDFGRNYPVVIWHQVTGDNVWHVLYSLVGMKANLLDEELAARVIEITSRNFRNGDGSELSQNQIVDDGDFEATHKEDSRMESTVEMLKSKGITLRVTPTRWGDEEVAINHLNGRMKIRSNGDPNIIIDPCNDLLIRCFEGAWVYETSTIKGYEYRKDKIAEIQPWIDIFDAMKYFITRVLVPGDLQIMRHETRKQTARVRVKVDADGTPIGYEETQWAN